MTLEALKRKIDTAKDLQSVVKTMKALAAVSIRQYEKAVVSLSEYNRTLEMGMQILLKKYPESLVGMKPVPTHRLGVVAFGSDQGMCGQFNERIADFTLQQIDALPIDRERRIVLTVGTRIRDRLEAAGQKSDRCFIVPGSITGIAAIVQETVLTLETWRRDRQLDQILVFNNRPISSATYRPHQQQIFPINIVRLRQLQEKKWNSRTLPTFTMSQERLVSALFRQYFFVSLYRACAESLASENDSRLASMQIAEKNIQERLSELQAEFNHQRQTSITEELLDIVSGFESIHQS
ncbi:MAG: F0F1 ATP synthase subunit gamma [Spirulina sp.]